MTKGLTLENFQYSGVYNQHVEQVHRARDEWTRHYLSTHGAVVKMEEAVLSDGEASTGTNSRESTRY